MLNKLSQKQLFDELYLLQNCELAMGAFYQELAAQFPEERFFWEEAVSDEVNHARYVGQLIAIVSTNLDKFNLGQYRVELLHTYIEGLYQAVAKLQAHQLGRKEILTLIQNYERSKVEQRPFDAVKSNHNGYLDLVIRTMPEIDEHSNRIQTFAKQKLKELEPEKIELQPIPQ